MCRQNEYCLKINGKIVGGCYVFKGKKMHSRLFFCVLLVLTLYGFALSAVIYVDQHAAGSGSGASWVNASTNLQSALNTAHSGDSLWIAAGKYLPSSDATGSNTPADPRAKTFAIGPGVRLCGGFSGKETSIAGRNISLNKTVLSGDIGEPGVKTDNAYHVITAFADVVVDGIIVSDGWANGVNEQAQSAAVVKNGPLTIVGCTFENNGALFGGVMLLSDSLPVDVVATTFSHNEATYAGGVFDIAGSQVKLNCVNTLFTHNASGTLGNAVYNSGASPKFTNCIFRTDSSGAQTYGLYNDGGSPVVVNCVIYAENFQSSDAKSGSITAINSIWGTDRSCVSGSVKASNCCTGIYAYSGVGNIGGDPLFVNAEAGDFHCKAGSPCVDKADGAAAPPGDFDGRPRFDYPKVANFDSYYADIGAFECVTLNKAPVIAAIRYTPASIGDTLLLSLDSMTIIDSDNVYPKDFGLCNPGGNCAVILADAKFFKVVPTTTSGPTISITVRVHDLLDTSPVFTVSFPAKRRVVYVAANAQGFNNGTSWSSAMTNLKLAMQRASDISEIWVAKGIYYPATVDTPGAPRASSFILKKNGAPLYGGFAGTETLREQRNWKVNESVLSGDIGKKGDSTDNAFHVLIGADSALLDGFTITGGNADSDTSLISYCDSCGGAMINVQSSPRIINCKFTRNYAKGGGAIFNYWGSNPSIENCIFCFNQATSIVATTIPFNLGGGAIWNNWSSNPVITSCVFYKNSVTENGLGGAIYQYWSDSMKVINCTFFDNDGPSPKAKGFTVEWGKAIVRNSIFVGTAIANADSRGPTDIAYSCLPPNDTTQGTGNIYVNPLFIDTTKFDFHLKPASLCIDQASGTYAPPLDMDGLARFDNPSVKNADAWYADIGAYEWVAATGTPVNPRQDVSNFSFTTSSVRACASPYYLHYRIPASVNGVVCVEIAIFDAKGSLVETVLHENKSAGAYEAVWGGTNNRRIRSKNAAYVARLRAGDFTAARQLFIVK